MTRRLAQVRRTWWCRVAVFVGVVFLAGTAFAEEATTTQPADPFGNMESYGAALLRMVVVLLTIIAGLLVVAKLLPRFLRGRLPIRSGKLIEVLECQRLEARKAIYLIRVGGQYILVGSSGEGLRTLAGGPIDQEAIAEALRKARISPEKSAEPPKRSFAQVLGQGSGE